jgi:hypothetical protein
MTMFINDIMHNKTTNTEGHYVESRILFIVMLNVITLNVVAPCDRVLMHK